MSRIVYQPGDFVVVKVEGVVGNLISFGEWLNGNGFTDYDHAEIYVGGGQTLGAYPGGARLRPVPPAGLPQLWSTGRIELTADERSKIVSAALACQGIPYSPEDYFALAAHRLHIPAPGLKDYIADSGSMICSQLVDFCYDCAGVRLFSDGRWAGYVTPADLAYRISHAEGITRG